MSTRLLSYFRVAVFVFAFTLPFFASDFVVLQIGVQSLYLAILAMSLAFIAGYGGMVSLVQISFYGVGGYAIAHITVMRGDPLWLAIIVALVAPAIIGAMYGLIAVRTEGIYFLMITLALSMLTFNFVMQNRSITKGFSGINGVRRPVFGPVNLENPDHFYYLALVIALLVFFGLRYLVNTPFGLALRAVRDNSRRMTMLGFNVVGHRVAAFTLSAFIAGIAGILGVWYNGQMSPGAIDLTRNINVLLIAVMGGLLYFEGSFAGAVFFVLVTTFASNFTDRYKTLIGVAFLLVALFLPIGFMGLFYRLVDLVGEKYDHDTGAGGAALG